MYKKNTGMASVPLIYKSQILLFDHIHVVYVTNVGHIIEGKESIAT